MNGTHEYRRVDLGRKTMRVEAPGCTIYIQREPNGGTRVDIVSDGERFADAVASCNVTQLQSNGSVRVDVEVQRSEG